MAQIFLGKDPDYDPVGQWNDGGGMVLWMYVQLAHVYEQPESGLDALMADVFAWAVRFAYEAIRAHEGDADEVELQDSGGPRR